MDREEQPQPVREESEVRKQEKKRSDSHKKDEEDKTFACNICFENATNPVVSLCGHMFEYGVVLFETSLS